VKNPLAAIKGLSTHMARNATDPKSAERLAIVAAEADRLQSIVESYPLLLARAGRAAASRPRAPTSIARELALLLETRAADARVTLEVTGSAEVELNADARKIRQALLNLVLNAMQASPTGEKVTIDVGRACSVDGFLRIRVIDRGAGMTQGGPRAHPEALLHDARGRHRARGRGGPRARRATRRVTSRTRARPERARR
jgi:two-component system sensor histidine kinase HydH